MKAQQSLVSCLKVSLGDPLPSEILRLISALSDEAFVAGREFERDIQASNSDPDY